ncbi:MAG: metallopeptidase family protein [Chloroflexi bacterium]|nr:metallopeptidase family protein [Chloroflexota bacterium]
MNHREFENAVAHVLDELPPEIARRIANVAIVVEAVADAETLDWVEIDDPYDLLGFYHGIPLTERTEAYGLIPPDKISIYREPILAMCENDDQVRECIRETLHHELAHYFGIDDARLDELGAY